MLVEGVVAVVLQSAGTEAPRPPVRLAMAAALIGANGQKQYEPPTIETIPTPQTPPSPGILPAPPPQQGIAPTPLVPEQPGVPVQGTLPAPLAESERTQMAQAAPSNSEILQRLDRLEQENQRLRNELEASKGQAAPPSAPDAPPRGQIPAQMVSGWRVSLYPWNPDGYVTGSPLAVFNVRNQRFDATLGQRPPKIDPRYVNRGTNATNEMFVYRFEGWLHVTRPGRHEIGFDVTCGFDHPCNLLVKIGGVQFINIQRQKFENRILLAGLDLTPSDYQVEVTFGLSKNQFINFDPHNRVLFYPLYRPPGEYNLRDFGPGELLTESSPSIPYGPPAR